MGTRRLAAIAVTLLVLALRQPAAAQSTSAARDWGFEQDTVDAPPAGFTFTKTNEGRMGRWLVRAMPGSEKVLVQIDDDPTRDRYPLALADGPLVRDLRLSVRCKPLSGRVDQACGLVFRYRDENDYYLTRANALEDNVRLYAVKDGLRRQLASWSGDVPDDRWSELRAEARGDHLTAFWNGVQVLDAHDATFGDAGRVGLWTKADSVTAFDDFTAVPVESREGAPR